MWLVPVFRFHAEGAILKTPFRDMVREMEVPYVFVFRILFVCPLRAVEALEVFRRSGSLFKTDLSLA